MKIAMPVQGEMISMHYGHSEGFIIYEVNDQKEVIEKKTIINGGIKGCEVSKLLADYKVDLVIVGGIGESAKKHLEEEQMEVKVGATGNIDTILSQYLNGTLELNDEVCDMGHEHHGEAHGHHGDSHKCCH